MTALTARPDRWLHLRLARPFTDGEFEMFRAHAGVFRAYVEASLAAWRGFGFGHDAPTYVFFPPELSADGTVATLPIGGTWTLTSRALFETGAAYLLWQHFPYELQSAAEEGLSEEHDGERETHWRPARRLELPHSESHAGELDSGEAHPGILDTAKRALWWVSGIVPQA